MAIAIDQATLGGNKQTGSGLGTTFSFTTTATVAAGATIIVCGGWSGVDTTITGVSGGGLSWTIDKQGNGGLGELLWIASAYAPAGLASGTTITATYGLSIAYPTIGGLSFTGIKTSAPVDGTPLGATGVATAGWSSGSYTTSGEAVIVAVDYADSVLPNTPTAPSVESQEQQTGTDQAHVIEYRIETAAGSYSVAGTWGAANNNTNIAVAYKVEAGTRTTFPLTSAANEGCSGEHHNGSYPPAAGDYVNQDNDPTDFVFVSKYVQAPNSGLELTFWRWDTSTIPDTATIISAYLMFYLATIIDSANDFSLIGGYYDFGGQPSVVGDMVETISPTILSVNLSTLIAGAVNAVALSDLSGISKTGVTGIRIGLSSGTPTTMNALEIADFSSANQEARLEVTYTTPDTGVFQARPVAIRTAA